MLEGQNTFAPTLSCYVTDGQNMCDQITSGRKVQMRVIKLHYVHSIHS